jgi:hypothetical protein
MKICRIEIAFLFFSPIIPDWFFQYWHYSDESESLSNDWRDDCYGFRFCGLGLQLTVAKASFP